MQQTSWSLVNDFKTIGNMKVSERCKQLKNQTGTTLAKILVKVPQKFSKNYVGHLERKKGLQQAD